jgi:hypothetical protein
MPLEDTKPNERICTDDLVDLIRKHQELGPFCMRVARQKLPVAGSSQPFAATGPVVDTGPALTGGSNGLLCVAGRVIVPMQTTLRTELLRRFHDDSPDFGLRGGTPNSSYSGCFVCRSLEQMSKSGFPHVRSVRRSNSLV